jgi:tRNA nucleotidyltransferase (CCA-adding enzyme)
MVGDRSYGSADEWLGRIRRMRSLEAEITSKRLRERLDAIPAVTAVRDAAEGLHLYLVGGAVRDLVLGLGRIDLDLAVEAPGDAVAALARRIDPQARAHERFGTATATAAGVPVDLAATRAEVYESPGALPRVEPAPIGDDLARRDFTLNAMAVRLAEKPRLLDPHGGLGDLGAGRLRVLHERSFADDPTRALRAARYAARLALALEPRTAELLRATDLDTVSAERVEAELRRLAGEPDPAAALSLLADWGLVEADVEVASAALEVVGRARWGGIADRAATFLAAAGVKAGRYRAPAAIDPARELVGLPPLAPSELTARARGRTGVELAIARALGADWLDRYVAEWRDVRLDIGGVDLLAAGVPEGPAVGQGLAAALAAKLDGQVGGRDAELAVALEAAQRGE